MQDQDPNATATPAAADTSAATPTPPVVETPAVTNPDPLQPGSGAQGGGKQGIAIPAQGAGDPKNDPGYQPKFGIEEAVKKIQAAKADAAGDGEGDGEAAPQRGADGKFLPKDGAKADDAASAVGADGKSVHSEESVPTLEELEASIPQMTRGSDKKKARAWLASQKALKADAEAAKTRAAEYEAKVKEYEARIASPSLPKDVEEELAVLRKIGAEHSFVSTPAFQRDYEAPLKANTERLEKLLTDSWKPHATEAEINGQLQRYRDAGFSPKVMAMELEWQKDKGTPESRYQIDRALGKREDLAQARADAIARQTAENNTGAAQRAEQTKAQQERSKQLGELAVKSTHEAFGASEAEIKKLLPFVAPEPPSEKDTPAVKQAKAAARAEYDGAVNAVRAEFARFAPDAKDPEKTARLTGEFQSLVLLGLLAKSHLLPRAAKELAVRDAAIAERDGKLSSYKKAGAVNASHLAAAQGGGSGKTELDRVAADQNRKPGDMIRAALAGVQAKQQASVI